MGLSQYVRESARVSNRRGVDKGALAIVEGSVERECAAVDKNSGNGRYTYDAESDCYTLEPIGTKVKRSFILRGTLYRELLQHQVEGIEWLWGVHCQYSGGIVADDMGLGKTFQATVFLSGLFHSSLTTRVIIIVPLSVLGQWPDELKDAGLEDLVHIYYNCDDSGLNTVLKKGGILLTTYDTYARNYQKLMGSSKDIWDYAVLDEAHKIKNIHSVTRELVTRIESRKKILLTGTPLQKDLMDLYSLVDFINPGLLGDVATFRKKYVCPISHGKYANATEIQKEDYVKAIEGVRSITTTYVLRRNKDVLIESGHLICKKNDMVIWLRLAEHQIKLYKKFENIFLTTSQKDKKSGLVKSSIWQAICNSPSVLLGTKDDNAKDGIHKRMKEKLLDSSDAETFSDEVNSCKTTFVVDLIKEIFEEEKEIIEKEKAKKEKEKDCKEETDVCKVLIFSRSIIMLDVLERRLNHLLEEDIIRIDGAVKKDRREELTKRFKSKNGPRIFMLSAKVGGEGLNLTAATRVIIIDPSWNCSDDDQIADRVYRMGQKRDVYIYRLVTSRTVEEHAYKTQLLKGALGRGIIEGTPCASSVHKKEGKVLCLPDPEVGFDSSETHKLLESTKANKLDFDGRHLTFLRSHPMVVGITNQNFVFPKDEMSRSDLLQEENDEDSDIENGREVWKAKQFQHNTRSSQMPITNRHPSKKNDAVPKQQDFTTRKMSSHVTEIPENKVGLLIGKDGETIKQIRLRSSAAISVEDPRADPSSSLRSVKITGSIEEIKKAKQMIFDVISKVVHNQEKFLFVSQHLVGAVIGKGGRIVKDIRQRSGACVEYVKNQQVFRVAGSTDQIDCAMELIRKIIDKTEKYVFVPEKMVGLVIGRQRRTLNEMQQKSGASIKFIDCEKKFLLTGNTQEVEIAESLILDIINKPCGRVSGGAIAVPDGYQRRGLPPQPVPLPGSRPQYYGERGPPGSLRNV